MPPRAPPSDEGDAGAGRVDLQHVELLVVAQRRLQLRRREALGQAALQGQRVGQRGGGARRPPAPPRPAAAAPRRQLPQQREDGVGRALRPAGGTARGGGEGQGDAGTVGGTRGQGGGGGGGTQRDMGSVGG